MIYFLSRLSRNEVLFVKAIKRHINKIYYNKNAGNYYQKHVLEEDNGLRIYIKQYNIEKFTNHHSLSGKEDAMVRDTNECWNELSLCVM